MLALQEISDRLEIQQLLADYCYAIDRHRWDDLDRVFTDDAVIDYTEMDGPRGDRRSTKDFLAAVMPQYDYYHMVATSKIEIDGDVAQGWTICHNPMIPAEGRIALCGLWYRDRFVRTPDGWRIRDRYLEKCYRGYLHRGDGDLG